MMPERGRRIRSSAFHVRWASDMRRRPLLELLVARFPEYSRDELYGMILCREVLVNGGRISNPREMVTEDVPLTLEPARYVSRGGEKLEYALDRWGIAVEGLLMLDAGASTGGFTDCLLQHGARGVYAVDVGYNQLSYRLRSDERVRVMERTNIMHVDALVPVPDAAVADLSFRSIRGAAGKVLSLTRRHWMIALIKPQFELDELKAPEDFSGVIHDSSLVENILAETLRDLAGEAVTAVGILASPITGRKGNREFLALLVDSGRYPEAPACSGIGEGGDAAVRNFFQGLS